jgi:hypothetical protein
MCTKRETVEELVEKKTATCESSELTNLLCDSNSKDESKGLLGTSASHANVSSLEEKSGVKKSYNPLKGARSLCLVSPDVCMLCNRRLDKSNFRALELEQFLGWVHCADCAQDGRLKEEVLYALEHQNLVPCGFLANSTRFKRPSAYETMSEFDHEAKKRVEKKTEDTKKSGVVYLHFFRLSKGNTNRHVQTGYLDAEFSFSSFLLKVLKHDKKKKLVLSLDYFDNGTKAERGGVVTLANLFYHNPELYEELTNTKNLLGTHSSVTVSYNEVPKTVRDLVEEAHLEALSCNNSSHFKY